MQAAEILQATAIMNDNERCTLYKEAGLVEVKRCQLMGNKIALVISYLRPVNESTTESPSNLSANSTRVDRRIYASRPKRYLEDEVIVAITEALPPETAIFSLMRVLSQRPVVYEIASSGFVNEEVMIQPTILALAREILLEISEYILPDRNHSMDSNSSFAVNASASLSTGNVSSSIEVPEVSRLTIFGTPLPRRIRFLGYSAGGAVASLASMIVDGSLNLTDSNATAPPTESLHLTGSYRNRVRCVSIAAPPVISRAIVSRQIFSMICGDDLIPRSSPESIQSLHDRVGEILVSGGGRGGFASWTASKSWLTDLGTIAKKGMQQYAAGSHDMDSLSIAGRVFYIKSRKHKGGATIQRVLRGNWREDMLWLLHEIVLSKKMIKHHSLEYYIQTLARC
jgi:hypothetical protein